MNKSAFLAGAAAIAFVATSARAQDASAPVAQGPEPVVQPATEEPDAPTADDLDAEGEADVIVVTGQRRGNVIGDIPPEDTLNARDIRATGATDINELLEAIAPQIGSARGRGGERPILLLNGQRISSFRELRDIPTEAIERVDILPEEVALRYGYRADQRVVNFVLRERFRSTSALATVQVPTGGGYVGGTADATRLMISRSGRTSVNLRAQGNGLLTEDERDVALKEPDAVDDRAARSLLGSKRNVRASVTHNRTVLGDVGATVNAEVEHNDGKALLGLDDAGLTTLRRDSSTDSAHAGLALNWRKSDWQFSSTANADYTRNSTQSDRPSGALENRSRSTTLSAEADITANGKLFELPAGRAGTTLKLAASTLDLNSRRSDEDEDGKPLSLGRTRGAASASVDLPLSRRNSDFSALGNLTLNANGEVEQLSDFGTLTTVGAGVNWSPVVRLNFIGSWTREDGAPSVTQLGNPMLTTAGSRVFDFTRGETVLATVVSGGNPDLLADRRNVVKIGANWQPIADTDLRLRAEYVRTSITDAVSSFPGPSAAVEAAFPERFERGLDGTLLSADLRPVNYDSVRTDTVRIGFDFTKPLKSAAPSPAQIEAFRSRRAAAGGGAPTAGDAPPGAGSDGQGAGERRGGRGFGGGRFGGGGGRNGGRLQFSLTDTIALVDRATIRPGLPKLDFLNGDAAGQSGGRPRHQVEGQAGYFNNGLGARLSANYRSGTQVDDLGGQLLNFAPLATFDLRLFANLGQRFDLVSKQPWLRGSTLRFEVKNIFDSKPKVRNAAGEVPFSYQPDLLDPAGRTIGITFRKLFLPARGSRRGGGAGAD
ncbi:TonB-dependent receptor plug domain-containing protein [Sphingomonas sinipercae]|uniref:TonB-dependent receptor plug domain-containing protein n=1 Tax=Sphingomonas sinipercae TaxID=2714944 RepID=A0A6G7ZKH4_9SPHN|nr:TonB-dependent receptor plug domain-containing protein [Sphingomonas sinipercae]QIL01410.1 TonB-dependent receptor plug domain-containing protein [Sphingomonas sinipercae]